ncbi:MAG: YggT family protein [Gammaproteobacteria bacterium]|nr:YggT family protein [Gammaproteobacteria bacterium]
MGAMTTALDFLLTTLFQLYIAVLLLRFLLQWAKADFYNPLSQFVVKVTTPLVRPVRRIVPGLGGLDLATLLAAWLLTVLQVTLVGTQIAQFQIPGLIDGRTLQPLAIVLVALLDMFALTISLFLIAIIIQALGSWFNPGQYNPVTALLHGLTEPLLRPARRLLPPISGIDLSPLLVLLALQVLKMLVIGLTLG